MANRYWVGGTGSWTPSNTANWSASSGGASGASVPTSVDDVFFDSASHTTSYTVTVATGAANCANLTFAAPATGDITLTGSQNINIYGNLTRYATMVYTYSGTLFFLATSGTKTITSAGGTYRGSINVNGSGATFQLVDDLIFDHAAGAGTDTSITLAAGTFDANGKKVGIQGGWRNFTIASAFTFYDLEILGSSFTTGAITAFINSNITVTGTFTVNGTSELYRTMVRPSSSGVGVGITRTITAANVSVNDYVNFTDIGGSGAGSWDLSATLAGDCGGNVGITFATPINCYWVHSTAASYFYTDSRWFTASGGATPARVPLPQDTAIFDANSFPTTGKSVVINVRYIAGMDWTGATNSPTLSMPGSPQTALQCYGSLRLVAGMTFTQGGSLTQFYFEGRSNATIRMAGASFTVASTSFWKPGATLTLEDAFTSSGALDYPYGNFNAAGYAVTLGSFSSNNSQTRVFSLGGGTWTLTNGAANAWVVAHANMTFTHNNSTIRWTAALTANRVFNTGATPATYYNLEIATTGAYVSQVTSGTSNITYNNIHIDASAAAREVQFTASLTYILGGLTRDGGSNVITIGSVTAANHTLTKTGGGQIRLQKLSISRSTATPANTWFAEQSTDGGNNSGWSFGYRVVAEASSYAYAGVASTLSKGYKVLTDIGAYSYLEVNPILSRGRRVLTDIGAYSITGLNPDVIYTPTIFMFPEAGAYNQTGVGIRLHRAIPFETGTYIIGGIVPARRARFNAQPSKGILKTTKVNDGGSLTEFEKYYG